MLADFNEEFQFVTVENVTNSFGGNQRTYTDGALFYAAITEAKRTYEANIAMKTGTVSTFHVHHPVDITFRENDVIKRVSNGKYYRITSNSKGNTTPKKARLQYSVVTAEVIEA